MPRVNVGRTIQAERDLAERIAFEMTVRGWKPDGLARRMTDAGCRIGATAIWKVVNQDPPRRVTVDELVALKMVFKLESTDELLRPVAEVRGEQAAMLMRQIESTWLGIGEQVAVLVNAVSEVLVLSVDDPDLYRDVTKLWFGDESTPPTGPSPIAQIVDDSGNVLVEDAPRLRDALSELLLAATDLAGEAVKIAAAGPDHE